MGQTSALPRARISQSQLSRRSFEELESMMIGRLAPHALVVGAACALAACSTLANLSAPDPNVSNSRAFVYTAIGASDAVGFGSSAPCNTAAVMIGADTEQMPSPASCPAGRGYVPAVSRLLATGVNTVTLTDL